MIATINQVKTRRDDEFYICCRLRVKLHLKFTVLTVRSYSPRETGTFTQRYYSIKRKCDDQLDAS